MRAQTRGGFYGLRIPLIIHSSTAGDKRGYDIHRLNVIPSVDTPAARRTEKAGKFIHVTYFFFRQVFLATVSGGP